MGAVEISSFFTIIGIIRVGIIGLSGLHEGVTVPIPHMCMLVGYVFHGSGLQSGTGRYITGTVTLFFPNGVKFLGL